MSTTLLLWILIWIQAQTCDTNDCYYIQFQEHYTVLDTCWNNYATDESIVHKCYRNSTYQITYDKFDCTSNVISNISIQNSSDCNTLPSCDYINVSYFDSSTITNTTIPNCDNIVSYFDIYVTNNCLFDSQTGFYAIHICTDTSWSISYYFDEYCTQRHLTLKFDDCEQNQYGLAIVNQCSLPFNAIDCGYIQFEKTQSLRPLRQCIIETDHSYFVECINNIPMIVEFNQDMYCDLSTNYTISTTSTPFSYSCSTNDCHYWRYGVCSPENASMLLSSLPLIVDECYSFFINNDVQNVRDYCDEQLVLTFFYQDSTCSVESYSGDLWWVKHEICGDQDLYSNMKCFGDLFEVINTTNLDKITNQTGYQTGKRVIYVHGNGQDDINCGELNHACGTIYYASLILYLGNVSHGEIIIQGQNIIDIAYWSHNGWGNVCVPSLRYLYTTFDASHTVIFTFDPN
eukprot:346745_1